MTETTKDVSTPIQQFADGLRKLATWYEEHADEFNLYSTDININIFAHAKEDFQEKAKRFGSAEKVSLDDWFMLRKSFSPTIHVDLNIRHPLICERVLVSEEVIPEHVIPAQPETVVPEKIEQKFEWRCPDSVLKADNSPIEGEE